MKSVIVKPEVKRNKIELCYKESFCRRTNLWNNASSIQREILDKLYNGGYEVFINQQSCELEEWILIYEPKHSKYFIEQMEMVAPDYTDADRYVRASLHKYKHMFEYIEGREATTQNSSDVTNLNYLGITPFYLDREQLEQAVESFDKGGSGFYFLNGKLKYGTLNDNGVEVTFVKEQLILFNRMKRLELEEIVKCVYPEFYEPLFANVYKVFVKEHHLYCYFPKEICRLVDEYFCFETIKNNKIEIGDFAQISDDLYMVIKKNKEDGKFIYIIDDKLNWINEIFRVIYNNDDIYFNHFNRSYGHELFSINSDVILKYKVKSFGTYEGIEEIFNLKIDPCYYNKDKILDKTNICDYLEELQYERDEFIKQSPQNFLLKKSGKLIPLSGLGKEYENIILKKNSKINFLKHTYSIKCIFKYSQNIVCKIDVTNIQFDGSGIKLSTLEVCVSININKLTLCANPGTKGIKGLILAIMIYCEIKAIDAIRLINEGAKYHLPICKKLYSYFDNVYLIQDENNKVHFFDIRSYKIIKSKKSNENIKFFIGGLNINKNHFGLEENNSYDQKQKKLNIYDKITKKLIKTFNDCKEYKINNLGHILFNSNERCRVIDSITGTLLFEYEKANVKLYPIKNGFALIESNNITFFQI